MSNVVDFPGGPSPGGEDELEKWRAEMRDATLKLAKLEVAEKASKVSRIGSTAKMIGEANDVTKLNALDA